MLFFGLVFSVGLFSVKNCYFLRYQTSVSFGSWGLCSLTPMASDFAPGPRPATKGGQEGEAPWQQSCPSIVF